MLSANYLYQCTDEISALYADLETEIIIDISRRLAKTGKVTAMAEWQALRAQESGALYDTIIKKVSQRIRQTEKATRKLFEEAGVKSLEFDDRVYKKAGLEPIPLMQSPAMLQTLVAGLVKTNGELRNLTMSMAIDGKMKFISAADMAYMKITSGAFDYNTAITQAIKELAKAGISTIDYASGRIDHVDVSVRRAVLTGVNQTAGKLTESRLEEMETDLVETSAHAGARPEHALWQGKWFSFSGTSDKYPSFKKVTKYGLPEGILGPNCRHSYHPVIEGISEPSVDPEDYKGETKSYNGKDYTTYEATQQQRKLERTIRKWKREKMGLESAGLDSTEASQKVREYQRQAKDFSEKMGITRRYINEKVII